MDWLFAVAALLLLATVVFDLVKTTLTLRGAGPVTSRAAKWGWLLLKRLDRRHRRRRLLSYAGPTIALLTVTGWLLGQWIAWTLFFSAGDALLVDNATGEPAGFWDRVYFAGFSLLTLGVGGFSPTTVPAQIGTNLAAALGFLTVSLSATYFIPTVSASATKRQLALHISSLGRTPEEILVNTWNGTDFGVLGQHLTTLAPTIIQVGQQHLAYPVLHYYFTEELNAAITVRLVALDEALAIAENGVDPSCRLSGAITRPATEGIGSYLASLRRLGIEPSRETPPLPPLDGLRRRGIPLVSETEFRAAMDPHRFRRRIALSLVQDSGRSWHDVVESATHRESDDPAEPRAAAPR